ncbi:hypothetical protein WH47_05767 [Habropoda laboriosa]|uniref:Uncharacterized protein n=1 Tax=Habropoda laboriosa TaxID=597456 RepID=A0A0L7QSL2_9HYME|nr:hypothetical protein WH47_05767 [Habropoda laboriosa]
MVVLFLFKFMQLARFDQFIEVLLILLTNRPIKVIKSVCTTSGTPDGTVMYVHPP